MDRSRTSTPRRAKKYYFGITCLLPHSVLATPKDVSSRVECARWGCLSTRRALQQGPSRRSARMPAELAPDWLWLVLGSPALWSYPRVALLGSWLWRREHGFGEIPSTECRGGWRIVIRGGIWTAFGVLATRVRRQIPCPPFSQARSRRVFRSGGSSASPSRASCAQVPPRFRLT